MEQPPEDSAAARPKETTPQEARLAQVAELYRLALLNQHRTRSQGESEIAIAQATAEADILATVFKLLERPDLAESAKTEAQKMIDKL